MSATPNNSYWTPGAPTPSDGPGEPEPDPVADTLATMFNVGGMELLVIAIVALVVLGPDKLPGAIRQVGQVTGELRRISKGFQTDLKGALEETERQAELEHQAQKQAAAAAPPPSTPDPGAARAAAQAELAAAEGARERAEAEAATSDTSSAPVSGAERQSMTTDPGTEPLSGGSDATPTAS